ncbi:MAG: acyl-CoA dehydrogenase [Bacteroidetes bacterium]|nr:acyl-CoA dehydrogenase [Bacteroidota bacterium]MCY4205539.1 acyl-CoA dehydrogenase [Bacteroidota bacterium]
MEQYGYSILTLWQGIGIGLVGALFLAYFGARIWIWGIALLLFLFCAGVPLSLIPVAAVLTAILVLSPLRRALLTGPMMHMIDRMGLLPPISDTERVALESGKVWVEGELFSGKPDWERIRKAPYPQLSPEEQEFLDGPVHRLCDAVDEWKVWADRQFSDEAWELMKRERMFGMIIPSEYGGLEFTAMANSAVVMKLQSHCGPLATTVMVPNSLGPAEMLIHYGTQAQREQYLEDLAKGVFLPAFALTEPSAGSDAGAIQADGVLFKDESGNVKIRLNWKKRYITLSSVAHVLGLAFKLRDPENILGHGKDPGITCALIPSDTPGIIRGRRHDPLGVPFVNAPFEGHDVEVPVQAIVGEENGAGEGWKMLMECLAAGRGISLPATSVGASKAVYLGVSAYAAVRRQFGLPIGKFEGIEEPLARIGGLVYLMDAARIYTLGAIDSGEVSAVVTAILKYNLTELGRKIVNDGMDIMGGSGISLGPRNILAYQYIANPIAITVEGANILTRTLIVFGQGALRCHPMAYQEIAALAEKDTARFDCTFLGHVKHVLRNTSRCLILGITRGHVAIVPGRGIVRKYIRRLNWASASFAFMADLAMISLGGALKKKEKITGRFADIFSWMFLASATLRRFEAEGMRKEDLPYFKWSMEYALAEIQKGFEGLLSNMKVPGLTWFVRGPALLWHRLNSFGRGPSDQLGHQVAQLMQTPGSQRNRIASGIYVPEDRTRGLSRLEHALNIVFATRTVEAKVSKAVRSGALPGKPRNTRFARAREAGIISEEELVQIHEASQAAWEAIQVDDFDEKSYMRHHVSAKTSLS